jgi:hypothetical protein
MKAINRIKAVLAEQQVSGKWLANEMGKAENTVPRWVSNKVQPSLHDLVDIAHILDVDVRTLIVEAKE